MNNNVECVVNFNQTQAILSMMKAKKQTQKVIQTFRFYVISLLLISIFIKLRMAAHNIETFVLCHSCEIKLMKKIYDRIFAPSDGK